MAIEHFESSCDQIFNQIYPYIKDHRVGTLSSVIYLILDKIQAQELCQEYSIKQNASLDEDFDLFDDIIYTVSIKKQKSVKENWLVKKGAEAAKNLTRPGRKSINANEDKDKMEFIVVAAVILIGVYLTQKYFGKNRKSDTTSPIPPSQSVPTAICLAIPASAVYGLTVQNSLNRDEMIEIIESATEFLCIEAEEANKKDVHTIDQEVSPDSQLKFYIRIDIPNGRNIINAKTKYVIKRDLPQNIEGQIIQLGRLRDASILKSFNRI